MIDRADRARLLYGRAASAIALVAGLLQAAPAFAAEADTAETAALDQITVTGSAYKNAEEIATRRNSLVVVDTLAQDDTGDLADQSLSEALTRVVGVSTMQVLYAETESTYVAVRGITPDLNHVSIDGISMASLSNGGNAERRVDLALIPAQAARKTEIYKTFTADQESGAVGGIINIVPHSAFDSRDGKFFVDAFANYRDYDDVPGGNSRKYTGSPWSGGIKGLWTKTFGADDQFGIVLSGTFQQKSYDETKFNPNGRTYYTADGESTSPDSPDWNGLYPAPQAFVSYDYTNLVRNFGGSAMLEYRPSIDWYASLMVFDYKQIEHQTMNAATLRAFRNITNQTDTGGTLEVPDIRTEYQYDRWETENRGAIFKTCHDFDPVSNIQFRAGYVKSYFNDDFNEAIYQAKPGDLLVNYDASGGTDTFTLNHPEYLTDAGSYTLLSARDMWNRARAETWEIKLDYTHNLDVDSTGFGYKLGGGVRDMSMNRDKSYLNYVSDKSVLGDIAYNPNYTPWMFNAPVLWIDQEAFANTVKPGLAVNETASANNGISGDYSYGETIAYAYASASYATDTTRVIAGVRFDAADYNAAVPYAVGGVYQTTFKDYDGDYKHFLPSLHVIHAFRDDLRLKASYSRTVGRAAPQDIAQPETVNEDSFSISRGNPDLKPRVSDNLDANLEYYFNQGQGFVSFGAFAKFIKDDIYDLKTEQLIDGVSWTVSTPMNANTSKMRGLEFQYVNNRIPGLPGFLKDRLGVSFNVTRTWGDMDFQSGDIEQHLNRMMFQREWMGNAAVFYQLPNKGEVRVAYNYQSDYIDGVGASPWLNRGPQGRGRLDASVRLGVGEDWIVKLQANNILDEKMYLGYTEDLSIRRAAIKTGRSFFINLIYKPL
ncbi:TonB-dependent receptor [Pedomonas mirosovicensis]|uniref:TonB-dependent receptor n=1 Tax=Pedomonas mirosovicensis TaxID=2908641 RepID=UPI002168F18E|nr:TonB-dependent receptor [Pedomonas mirosovicensis]MCH8686755.1 TonB-dependent receptor [Pedomonas mirosovicensis]